MIFINKRPVIAAHQPNLWPALVNLSKLMQSDIWIIRDDCQWVKNDYHHRQRILSQSTKNNFWRWITIPVNGERAPLKEKTIKSDVLYKRHHYKKNQSNWIDYQIDRIEAAYISNRIKPKHFNEYFPVIKSVYKTYKNKLNLNTSETLFSLVDFNIRTLHCLMDAYQIKSKEIIFASELNSQQINPSLDIVNLIKKIMGNKPAIYFSGIGGKSYLKVHYFQSERIEVALQNFEHPIYFQNEGIYIPNLAGFDPLFFKGPEIIKHCKELRTCKFAS